MHAAPRFTLARLAFCCTLLTIVAPAAWAQDRPAASGSRQAPSGTSRQSSTRSDWRRASFLQDVPQGEGVMEAIPGPYVEGHPVVPEFLGPGPGPHGDCGCQDCRHDYYGEGCCVQDACRGCGCCGWYAGVEVFWAQPRIKDPQPYTLITGSSASLELVATPFQYDYHATPRIWLGYADCCGFGVRASWWEFEDADSVVVPFGTGGFVLSRVSTIFFGDVLDNLSASQRLELELADVEFTNGFDLCGGCAVVAYGLRYVRYALEIL